MLCVALDVDGILIDEKGRIFPELKYAIQKQWDSAYFTLASGRPPAGIEYILRQIDRDGYYVAFNGGFVAPGIGQAPLLKETIPYGNNMSLFKNLLAHDLTHLGISAVFVYTTTQWLAWGDSEAIKEEAFLTNYQPRTVKKFEDIRQLDVIKITLVCRDQSSWEYLSIWLNQLSLDCSIIPSRPYYLEITNANTSKGSALQIIKNKLNPSQLISVGDGENDLSMFAISDISFTISTAKKKIKDHATYVIQEPIVSNLATLINMLEY